MKSCALWVLVALMGLSLFAAAGCGKSECASHLGLEADQVTYLQVVAKWGNPDSERSTDKYIYAQWMEVGGNKPLQSSYGKSWSDEGRGERRMVYVFNKDDGTLAHCEYRSY